MISRVQHGAASIDTSLFYYMKGSFFQWCNMEDSFWRFILDAWVRTIVTLSDNTLLVFQTLPAAFLFHIALSYCLVPVVACVYASIQTMVYFVEARIPRTESLTRLEATVQMCDLSRFFGLGMLNPLPTTYPRTRPPMDIGDDITYRLQRKLRHFNSIYRNMLVSLQNLTWHLITWTMGFRLVCIWFGLNRPLRFFLSVFGFGSTISSQEQKFSLAKSMLINESLLWSLFGNFLKSATVFLGFMPSRWIYGTMAWLLICTVVITCCIWICNKIVLQRRDFFKSKGPQVGWDNLLQQIAEKEHKS